ncbi:MAG TPA: SDR family NAD(P)-dependent oxidoreductase [Fimbriimonas sp.]|nr:SDR family NAD(P)-dependent oxidoreductase [Fimbriimonas sp.]
MLSLEDRHVLIVGGSRGIGASAARLSAKAGADVSIIYRSNEKAAQDVLSTCRAEKVRAEAFQADVADEAQLVIAIAEAVDKLGAPDGLVISAGVFEGLPLEEMSVEFWDRVMAVNVRATFVAVREAVRYMRRDGMKGSIVIYTSTAGQRGSSVFSAYATSKGAQIMFMRSMARELGPEGIRVNCIAPAWTETDMADASLTELGRENVAKDFVLGRIGQPGDVANATVFLLSDLASFVTGTTLTVDGGMDMRG